MVSGFDVIAIVTVSCDVVCVFVQMALSRTTSRTVLVCRYFKSVKSLQVGSICMLLSHLLFFGVAHLSQNDNVSFCDRSLSVDCPSVVRPLTKLTFPPKPPVQF